ncbi:MAG: glycosyltransferase, partial [Bryobacteraceae bacterium]
MKTSDTDSSARHRILYVHNSADLYGASRSLLRLLTALDRSRFEPTVVLPETGPLAERLEGLGVDTVIDPSLAIISRYTSKVDAVFLRFLPSSWKLLRLIRRRKIDLVHTNSGVIFSPAFAAWLARVPHVWHIRESFDEFRGVAWQTYTAYMRTFSDRIISVSTA